MKVVHNMQLKVINALTMINRSIFTIVLIQIHIAVKEDMIGNLIGC